MEYFNAFWVGGLICLVGQLLIDLTKLTPARIMVTFVTMGVLLGGIGLYGPLVDYAGAGATVPLCGFGCGGAGLPGHLHRGPDRRGGRHHSRGVLWLCGGAAGKA